MLVVTLVLAAGTSPGIAGVAAEKESILVWDGTAQVAPSTRGRWTTRSGGFSVATAPPFGDALALWMTPQLSDGLVRARFIVTEDMKNDLLVRADANRRSDGSDAVDGSGAAKEAGADPLDELDELDELDGGLGVSLERDRVRLVRFEHRMHRFLGIEEALSPKPRVGSVIEVIVVVVGPWLQATVYDERLRRLAHVAVLDRGFVDGGVGVRVARGQNASTSLLSLSVAPTSLAARQAQPPDLGWDGEGTGAGAERLIGIAVEDVARLPASLGSARTIVVDGLQYLDTDVMGVELVRRAGIAVRSHRTQMPFLHKDPTLAARLGQPPTKTSRGFRVDESYKDAAMVEALLRAYAERFPAITRLEELGRSREGRPILALVVGRGGSVEPDVVDRRPAVLLDAGHHGGELMSTELVLDAIQLLVENDGRDADLSRFVNEAAIWCVPLVNVDGNFRYVHETRDYDRKNARDIDDNGRIDGWDGVDLYRQYPVNWGGLGEVGSRSWPYHYRYRGPQAGSEPEIVAMMRLAERERFAASIDFHTAATKILVPYTDPSLVNPATNEAWSVAMRIADRLPLQVNKRRYEVQRNLYPVDGTAQDWFRFAHGTVALLVEAPQHNPLPYDRGRRANVIPSRGTWRELLRAVVDGPAVQVRVRDAAGAPVEAVVVVEEQAPRMGERWTSRPRDGLAVRLLSAPGPVNLRVSVGDRVIHRRIEVGAEVKRVELTLP